MIEEARHADVPVTRGLCRGGRVRGPARFQGRGTAVAAFVGLAEHGPFNQPTLVSSWTAFTDTFGGFVPGSYLARSVYGYFMNGGGNCYVVRIGQNGSEPAKPPKELPAGPHALAGWLRFTAIEAATPPGDVTVEITDAGGENPGQDMFRVVVKQLGEQVEEYDRVTVGRGKSNVATVVNAASALIRVELVSVVPLERPQSGELALSEPTPPPVATPAVGADDYVGDVADRSGMGGLETVDEITMLCVPYRERLPAGRDRCRGRASGPALDDRAL